MLSSGIFTTEFTDNGLREETKVGLGSVQKRWWGSGFNKGIFR